MVTEWGPGSGLSHDNPALQRAGLSRPGLLEGSRDLEQPPVGIQVVAPHGADRRLLEIAAAFEEARSEG